MATLREDEKASYVKMEFGIRMEDMERQERWDRGECSDHDSDEEENILRAKTRKRDCTSPVRRRLPNWQQQWVCGQTRLLQRRITVRMHKQATEKEEAQRSSEPEWGSAN